MRVFTSSSHRLPEKPPLSDFNCAGADGVGKNETSALMKKQKRGRETIQAAFTRMLDGKPDMHQTLLELERDDEPGNMNIPGAVMAYHIIGIVPDGEYTLTYGGKAEPVRVRANKIIWQTL